MPCNLPCKRSYYLVRVNLNHLEIITYDHLFLYNGPSQVYLIKPGGRIGAQWLSGRVLDSSPRSRGFEPHGRRCVVSLSKNINSSLILVQPRKTRPFITERSLMGRKESNQTKRRKNPLVHKGVEHNKRLPFQMVCSF